VFLVSSRFANFLNSSFGEWLEEVQYKAITYYAFGKCLFTACLKRGAIKEKKCIYSATRSLTNWQTAKTHQLV
jgi:hypothetical protein